MKDRRFRNEKIKIQTSSVLEMHISRREIGKREIGNREISRGKLGTGKSGKYREKLHIFRAKMTQKRLKIMPKILPKYANFNMYD